MKLKSKSIFKQSIAVICALLIFACISPAQDIPAREFFLKGNEESKKGNFDAAIEAYSAAIKLDSEYAYAYNGRGLARMRKRQYNLALSDYSIAISLSPESVGYYINRSSTYSLMQKFDQAFADLKLAAEINPKFPEVYSSRGHLERRLKRYADSIESFTQAIVLKPYSYFYAGRCMSYYDYEKYQEAVTDCSEAINLNPKDSNAFFYRGLSRIKLEHKTLAIGDLRRALEINPNSSGAQRELDKITKEN